MFSIRFSPNNQDILAAMNQGVMTLYDVERRRKVWSARVHADDVNTVCYVEEQRDNIFVSGSDDATVKIWDRRLLRNGDRNAGCVGGFLGHDQGITCVASRGDGRFIISNSKDQSIKLWDLRKMQTLSEVQAWIAKRAQAPPQFVDYRWDRYRRTGVRLPEDHSLMTYIGHSVHQTLIRCSFSPMATTGCAYIISGSYSGAAVIYEAATGRILATLDNHHTSIIRDVAWHPTLPFIVTASWDTTICRWAPAFLSDEPEAPEPSSGSSSSSSIEASASSAGTDVDTAED